MFKYKLEHPDGTAADPATYTAAVPNWKAGDTIPLGPGKTLRVVDVKPGRDPNEAGVLVVERV